MYKLAINRPITTLMGVMVFIVFGLISFKTMPVNLFPNVDFPIVTIQTAYFGADAKTVESKVTEVIEEAVSGIDGIDKLISTSYDGLSVVTIQFELSRDIVECANDVRDKIGAVSLNSEIEKPIVKKFSASAGSVINLFITSKNGDTKSLMKLADEKIKPQLQRVQGVGEVNIIGFRDREVRVFIDPFLLNKYNISATELEQAISTQNVRLGSGKLISTSHEFIIKTAGDSSSVDELKNIKIKSGVMLKDIADVRDDLSDAKTLALLDGKEGVMLEIKKISGENALNIISHVKELMPKIESIAGKSYELRLLQDQSEKIMLNINRVKFDLIYGACLAILIVFLFLRNLSATIISAFAIPTSIIGTFAIIDWLGYDLNRLSLIGLTLAIGIFIDDAIVVIENIAKKMEAGLDNFEATFEGVKEIAFSVLAISAMLLAVFIPVAFMGGIVGKFFNSFAMTVASGIIISYFVVIMFIPTLSARFLVAKESKFYHATEPILQAIDRAYLFLLKPLIRFKTLTIIGTIGLLFFSTTLLKNVGMEFVPMEDNSELQIIIKAPIGTSLESMKKMVEPILKEVESREFVEYAVLSIGYTTAKEMHKAKIYAKLVPVEKRAQRQEMITQEFRELFSKEIFQHLKITVE
ncbi:MAG: efflux RND transporter permease subunit, partial [Campylobacterales bacterium]|nr:efflux RND transporter permease subunit [Campylobacterales bacterium]